MGSLGRILVADDEETFLHATGDLLRRGGGVGGGVEQGEVEEGGARRVK